MWRRREKVRKYKSDYHNRRLQFRYNVSVMWIRYFLHVLTAWYPGIARQRPLLRRVSRGANIAKLYRGTPQTSVARITNIQYRELLVGLRNWNTP